MRLGIEKRLLIPLPVNVDEKRAQIAEQRVCGELIVDEDLVSAGGRNLAANYEFVRGRQTCIIKERFEFRIRSHREEPLDRSAFTARLQQFAGKSSTDQHAERVDNDRLARPRLTRKQIEPILKLNLQTIDEGYVGDIQELKHRAKITQIAQIYETLCVMCGAESAMTVNFIDILLVLVIALSVMNGYRRGFVRGVLDLAGWVLSLIAALRYYQSVAQWLGPRIDLWSEVWDQPIAFVIVALVTGVIVHVIGYWALQRLSDDIEDSQTNH